MLQATFDSLVQSADDTPRTNLEHWALEREILVSGFMRARILGRRLEIHANMANRPESVLIDQCAMISLWRNLLCKVYRVCMGKCGPLCPRHST